MTELDELLKTTRILPQAHSLTPDEEYSIELYLNGLPTHYVDSDGKLQPRTRPPDKVIVPPPTFKEPGR